MENNLLKKSFLWMFFGLILTGSIAWYTYQSETLMQLLIQNIMTITIIQLVAVIVMALFFRKLPAAIVTALFIIYASINGLMFSTYFFIYELQSIAFIFIGTSILFLILGLVGFNTEKDLSGFGRVLFIGLLVGLVMTIINIFLKNSMLDIILCWAMLGIFCGITIYDVNKLKNTSLQVADQSKLHIYFAFELYLDFINIFIRLMQLFGKKK